MLMKIVDHIGVASALAMLVPKVGMVCIKIDVIMRKFVRIRARPQQISSDHTKMRDDRHGNERHYLIFSRAKLASKRIADQPASVAQGELRRKECRPIFRIGRPFQ